MESSPIRLFQPVKDEADEFIGSLQKKQIINTKWLEAIPEEMEIGIVQNFIEAISAARAIQNKVTIDPEDIITFQSSLEGLESKCRMLEDNYQLLFETGVSSEIRELHDISINTLHHLQEIYDGWGIMRYRNITFRHGLMQDEEVFNQTELFVLPINTAGGISDGIFSLSQEFNITAPKSIAPGDIILVKAGKKHKTGPMVGWACSVAQEGSDSQIIEVICKRLTTEASIQSLKTIGLPLLGTGAGRMSPLKVVEIYVNFLTNTSTEFLVSIPSVFDFAKIVISLGPFFESGEIPPPIGTNPRTEPNIKSRLISDNFSPDEADVLQYDVIAQNLFAILTKEDTNPPLNIGIFAPWGRGKTSLMKKLQKKFDEARIKELNSQDRPITKLAGWKAFMYWLHSDEINIQPNIPYATVWFNPWNYQSSDMIWAGMADAVIEQVVAQIPSKTEKEIFWLQLRLARLAKEKIRKKIQTLLFSYAFVLVLWGILVLLAFFFFGFQKLTATLSIAGTGGLVVFLRWLAGGINPLGKAVTTAFDKYSDTPKYQDKTGTFHEVQADLNKVLDLCIDKERQMVIFIDDLDRCSPSKVVEVVEAINVFINGRFNYKCYFILGMDGEMVAGALDVSYEKMKGKFGSREMDHGSVGWYFLDKFIQLPYFIPVMSEAKKKEYLASLLMEKNPQGNSSITQLPPADMTKVHQLAETVMSTSDNRRTSTVIQNAVLTPEEKSELDKVILQKQVESEKQNEEISLQVQAYAPYISSDPRSLKRFANLLRFHCAYQFLRMKKGQPYVEVPILAKWLAIMLKFPQMIRWIQWDSENRSGINSAAEEKVKLLDQLWADFIQHEDKKDFSDWLSFPLPGIPISNGAPVTIKDYTELPWLRSRQLFDILLKEQTKDGRFCNALDCNVW